MKHDAAGNMIYDGRYVYTYDAWNRMVTVTKAYPDADADDHAEEGSLIATMAYDGLGRRVSKAVTNSGDLDCTYHYYYAGHSLIEEHDGSQNVLKQYVWGRMYIDELVQIGVNDDPEDGEEDNVESFFYALHNANFNVMAIVDDDGVIVERYEYDPYGQRQVFISTGDNDPHAHGAVYMSQRVTTATGVQAYALNPFGHQGLYHDEAIELVYNRARMLNPRAGRFMQRDPLRYVGGMNQFAGYHIMNGQVDPFGLKSQTLQRRVDRIEDYLSLGLTEEAAGEAVFLATDLIAGGKVRGMSLSSEFMQRWLDKRGGTRTLTEKELSSLFSDEGVKVTIYNQALVTHRLYDGPTPVSNLVLKNIIADKDTDFFTALGFFQVNFSGTYCVTGTTLELDGDFSITDTYDWQNPGDKYVVIEDVIIYDRYFTLVEDANKAKAFDVDGTFSYEYEYEGQGTQGTPSGR